ncbi:hypothetical protein J6TS2_33420 [Heyndrickxia sporothermodurans]|nr:hypothetical protein J6TS2_33420 [Heyndrickxia sporothermodurans]
MILTNEEKKSIANMESGQLPIIFDAEVRSNYQYEVEKPSNNEWRVLKFAIMCLAVEYFNTPEEVINYIER